MPVYEPAPSGPRDGSAPERGAIAPPRGPVTGRGRRVTAVGSICRLRSGTGGQRRSLLPDAGVDRLAAHSRHPADRRDVHQRGTSGSTVSVLTAEPPLSRGARQALAPACSRRAACCSPAPEPAKRTREEGNAMSVTSDAADPAVKVHQTAAELAIPGVWKAGLREQLAKGVSGEEKDRRILAHAANVAG